MNMTATDVTNATFITISPNGGSQPGHLRPQPPSGRHRRQPGGGHARIGRSVQCHNLLGHRRPGRRHGRLVLHATAGSRGTSPIIGGHDDDTDCPSTASWSWSARAMWACRWRCARPRWATGVVGFDVDGDPDRAPRAGESPVEDISDARLRAALDAGRYLPTTDPADLAGFDVAVISVPTPLTEGTPDLSHIDRRGRQLARPPPARGHRRAGVDHLPGHHRGAAAAAARGRLRARWPVATSTWATAPSASTRATRRGTFENTPKVVSGIDAASLGAVAGFYDRLVERTVPRVVAARGRAHQAAREHLPPREHRPGQRAGDVRPRPGHRRVGGHRRRVDQAVRLPAVHPRSRRRAATACRSTRPTCRGACASRLGVPFRFVELANDVNEHMPDYVVRRPDPGPQPAQAAGQRPAHPAARAVLQAQHRRRPRDAVTADRPRSSSSWAPRSWSPTPTSTSGCAARRRDPGRPDARGGGVVRRGGPARRPRRLRPRGRRRRRRVPARHPPPRRPAPPSSISERRAVDRGDDGWRGRALRTWRAGARRTASPP